MGKPQRLSPGVWGRRGHPFWRSAVGLGFRGKAKENRGRVREVLAKLCGRSGEGRCASLQTRVRSLAPRLAGGVCAPAHLGRRSCGALHAQSQSLQRKQAEQESSIGTQTYFCPGNPSFSEVPSVSAITWDWSVQVECWSDSESDFSLPWAICTLHFGVLSWGGQGRASMPLLAFS